MQLNFKVTATFMLILFTWGQKSAKRRFYSTRISLKDGCTYNEGIKVSEPWTGHVSLPAMPLTYCLRILCIWVTCFLIIIKKQILGLSPELTELWILHIFSAVWQSPVTGFLVLAHYLLPCTGQVDCGLQSHALPLAMFLQSGKDCEVSSCWQG